MTRILLALLCAAALPAEAAPAKPVAILHDAAAPQQIVDLVGEPGGVPELHRGGEAGGQLAEERGEPIDIAAKNGWELEEHHAEPVPEARHAS